MSPSMLLVSSTSSPRSSRQGLIGSINQWARLEKTRLQLREEKPILEDIFLGNKKVYLDVVHIDQPFEHGHGWTAQAILTFRAANFDVKKKEGTFNFLDEIG